MTTLLESIQVDRVKAARRQRVGVINRRLGWAILPLVIAAVTIHYSPLGEEPWSNNVVRGIQMVFVPMLFVHLVLSVYVFGLVRPSRSLRVFHVWFGYAYILIVLASQTRLTSDTVHAVLTVAMFSCLTLHVAIGIYYAKRRREASADRMPVST